MKKLATVLVLALAFTAPAWAALKTVTLTVDGMYCASCPITVKRGLSKVEGVTKIEVNYEAKEVVVTFDDAKTTLKALTDATANAGYPSTVKK
ncbi:mercury resistance system periplasmic binding protein MerP [Pseudoxanthomonas sp. SE1]|uniref:mercury resistance system periplasmic binding protein MerP n=1 Tax=Pseudoxanthomonas sp. SE1 TaxID=1664560 RepID=UPI00240D9CCB|nr:mercury resistance system periplasmic binding protein MerP [Pseudoxanthomonas sp. SE1]WFC40266.1 mercury resistance system periplasmic binding protein MerP [Pseudoxanthomonas sp. SE1]WFC43731.1 mercury resistance system periplasmic binding protein MerP [Pseudoxanthomonas sp. SE1]